MRISLLLILSISLCMFSCKDDDTIIPVSETPISETSAVYLDSNGVTIKAYDWAKVGDTDTINGVLYTVVDESTLRNLILSNADISNVCVSRVTNMRYLFYNRINFNQDISSWDVSNVTDISSIFRGANFGGETTFNQPLNNWDVSNVTFMANAFYSSTFNQDISSWNVSNVTSMNAMFSYSRFNQNISSWDVSNVRYMNSMFEWGGGFNQDLSGWNVDSVFYCRNVDYKAVTWTLPKPNFTNCTP